MSARQLRWQFSLRLLLLTMATVAVAVAGWRILLWRPPTHQIGAYEQAPTFHGLTATVGPNQIRIESVARNQRDGTIVVQSGRGKSLAAAIAQAGQLRDCAGWLDVAQIDLQPGTQRIEILEVRVFDHHSNELLHLVDPRYGWRLVAGNQLHLYGLNKALPNEIDLWMRVNSYASDDQVHRLPAAKGASVTIDEHDVAIESLQAGFAGWSSGSGFLPVEGEYHAESAVELGWTGSRNQGISDGERRYQVAAIDQQSQRFVDDTYLALDRGESKKLVIIPAPLATIDHLEIRPFGGRHRVCFIGLQLPPTDASETFTNPPTATVFARGQAVQQRVTEFLPLQVVLEFADGQISRGSRGNSDHLSLIPNPDGPRKPGEAFSLIVDERGLGNFPLSFRFREVGNQSWLTESMLAQRGSAGTGNATRHLSERSYETPLSDIDAVEITLNPE